MKINAYYRQRLSFLWIGSTVFSIQGNREIRETMLLITSQTPTFNAIHSCSDILMQTSSNQSHHSLIYLILPNKTNLHGSSNEVESWPQLTEFIYQLGICKLIPVAEQCSSTACIGPHHCGHRTGAVLSSDKHWHAVLEHCLALLKSYDSSTAVSAVTGRSGIRVTVLGHCKALPYDPVTASVKDYTKCGKLRSSAPSTACQCFHWLS